MLLRRLSLLLAIAWMAWIFWLSNQPVLDLPSLFPNQDKVIHFGFYAVLASLLLGATRIGSGGYTVPQALLAAVLASAYGISDEIHQMYVPGRDPDPFDWLADTSGALVATLMLAWLSRRLLRAATRPA